VRDIKPEPPPVLSFNGATSTSSAASLSQKKRLLAKAQVDQVTSWMDEASRCSAKSASLFLVSIDSAQLRLMTDAVFAFE